MEKRLIIHIPHSSTHIPFYDGYVCGMESLGKEILLLTDWFTDDLFYSEKDLMIVTEFSRIFCDVERFADDNMEAMAKKGMGVCYEALDAGGKMRNVSHELKQKILKGYYHKHHQRLENAVASQLEETGSALILDAHSFPDKPFKRDMVQSNKRPDICIGTDDFHTPKGLVDCSVGYFASLGYSIGINSPYAGSIVPMRYYQKDKRVSSIMLEINRKLYLKDTVNQISDGYYDIKKAVQGYIRLLRRSM